MIPFKTYGPPLFYGIRMLKPTELSSVSIQHVCEEERGQEVKKKRKLLLNSNKEISAFPYDFEINNMAIWHMQGGKKGWKSSRKISRALKHE